MKQDVQTLTCIETVCAGDMPTDENGTKIQAENECTNATNEFFVSKYIRRGSLMNSLCQLEVEISRNSYFMMPIFNDGLYWHLVAQVQTLVYAISFQKICLQNY